VLDGRDVSSVLAGAPEPALAERTWFFYRDGGLEAVRRGRWKLHLPHPYMHVLMPGVDGRLGTFEDRTIGSALFDLEADPAESEDVAVREPAVVAGLAQLAEEARVDLGDSLTGRRGAGVRPPGRPEP
jgi:arylsulfatase A